MLQKVTDAESWNYSGSPLRTSCGSVSGSIIACWDTNMAKSVEATTYSRGYCLLNHKDAAESVNPTWRRDVHRWHWNKVTGVETPAEIDGCEQFTSIWGHFADGISHKHVAGYSEVILGNTHYFRNSIVPSPGIFYKLHWNNSIAESLLSFLCSLLINYFIYTY